MTCSQSLKWPNCKENFLSSLNSRTEGSFDCCLYCLCFLGPFHHWIIKATRKVFIQIWLLGLLKRQYCPFTWCSLWSQFIDRLLIECPSIADFDGHLDKKSVKIANWRTQQGQQSKLGTLLNSREKSVHQICPLTDSREKSVGQTIPIIYFRRLTFFSA